MLTGFDFFIPQLCFLLNIVCVRERDTDKCNFFSRNLGWGRTRGRKRDRKTDRGKQTERQRKRERDW